MMKLSEVLEVLSIVVIRIFELEYSAGMFSLMEYCHEDIAYTPSLVNVSIDGEFIPVFEYCD